MSQRLIHMLLKRPESTEADIRVNGPDFVAELRNHCCRLDRGPNFEVHKARRSLKAIEISRARDLLAQSLILGILHNPNNFELLPVLLLTKPAEFLSNRVSFPDEIAG